MLYFKLQEIKLKFIYKIKDINKLKIFNVNKKQLISINKGTILDIKNLSKKYTTVIANDNCSNSIVVYCSDQIVFFIRFKKEGTIISEVEFWKTSVIEHKKELIGLSEYFILKHLVSDYDLIFPKISSFFNKDFCLRMLGHIANNKNDMCFVKNNKTIKLDTNYFYAETFGNVTNIKKNKSLSIQKVYSNNYHLYDYLLIYKSDY
jgi:hypothetical protein